MILLFYTHTLLLLVLHQRCKPFFGESNNQVCHQFFFAKPTTFKCSTYLFSSSSTLLLCVMYLGMAGRLAGGKGEKG